MKVTPGVAVKRCGICHLSRSDGVIIYRAQGYCKDCMKQYRQIYRLNENPEDRIRAIAELKKSVLKSLKLKSTQEG